LLSQQFKNPNPKDIKKAIKALNRSERWGFRIIFDCFHAKVYNTAKKMGITHEDAEGIVQDLFLFLWERRTSIDHKLSINSYLLTITKRMVIKRVKRDLLKKNYHNQKQKEDRDYDNGTEDYLIFSETERNLKDSIHNLPDHRRQIFMLSRESGLTNDEISEKLNISKRTVENQLYRATKSIKDDLNEGNI